TSSPRWRATRFGVSNRLPMPNRALASWRGTVWRSPARPIAAASARRASPRPPAGLAAGGAPGGRPPPRKMGAAGAGRPPPRAPAAPPADLLDDRDHVVED